jgi:hypothetical protein
MYVPHSGDMNYINAGNAAVNAAFKAAISRIAKTLKNKRFPQIGNCFRKLNLNNA